MESYAYKVVVCTRGELFQVEGKLNELSQQGWRVIEFGVGSSEYGSDTRFVWTLERVGLPKSPDQGRI